MRIAKHMSIDTDNSVIIAEELNNIYFTSPTNVI